MKVLTKHKDADIGMKLELNHQGEIVQRTPCARQTGTTITLTNLFATLPVRKREFTNNIKKEFSKMCTILQGYGLISYGKRIILTNQTAKSGKTTIMSTNGSQSLLDNIVSIFGSKQKNDLLEIRQPVEQNEVLTQEIISSLDTSIDVREEDIDSLGLSRFHFDGFVSSCRHGSGRSVRDRQFFFINGRPFEPKSIVKLVNDTYHRYNANQSPFIVLNIIVQRSDVDVNVSKDKREILLNNEAILRLALKKSLLSTFGQIPSSFKMQNTTLPAMFGATSVKPEKFVQPEATITDDASDTSSVDDDFEKRVCTQKGNPGKYASILSQWKSTGSTDGAETSSNAVKRKPAPLDDILQRNMKMKKIHEYLSQEAKADTENYSYKSESESDEDEGKKPKAVSNNTTKCDEVPIDEPETKSGVSITDSQDKGFRIDCKVKAICTPNRTLRIENFSPTPIKTITQKKIEYEKPPETEIKEESPMESNEVAAEDSAPDNASDEPMPSQSSTQSQKIVTVSTSIAEIKELIEREQVCEQQTQQKANLNRLKFKAKIDPSKSKMAEQELSTEISKEDFARMEIIGQFNLGFIIVCLDNDLFIIDQHATDEKYNFETLQKITCIQHQNLVVPQPLQLTAVNEMILIDNLAVFEMNGFRFDIDMERPVTKRIKLVAKPFSKNWEFGKEDIDELIFMLQEGCGDTASTLRPSRVQKMFASRACRSSVMIGTPLQKSDMRRLVDQMGTIEQPWVRYLTFFEFVPLKILKLLFFL